MKKVFVMIIALMTIFIASCGYKVESESAKTDSVSVTTDTIPVDSIKALKLEVK